MITWKDILNHPVVIWLLGYATGVFVAWSQWCKP